MSSTRAALTVSFTKLVVDPAGPNDGWAKQMGDLDGDGYLDLVVVGDRSEAVWYRFNPDTGTFNKSLLAQGTDTQSGSALVDMVGDGYLDLVVGTAWYENPRRAGSAATTVWKRPGTLPGGSHDIRAGDLDGDGLPDVVMRPETSSTVDIFYQVNKSTFTRVRPDPGFGLNGLELLDVDRDGRLDVITPGRWMRNPGGRSGEWAVRSIGDWPAYAAIASADMNGDGRIDLVFSNSEQSEGRVSWFECPPDPLAAGATWTEHAIDTKVGHAHAIAVRDMDLDGRLDVIASEFADEGRLLVWSNAPDGWKRQVVGTTRLHNIAVGDYDNDGDIDIFGVQAFGKQPVEVWRNEIRSGIGAPTRIQVFSRTVPPGFRHDEAIVQGTKTIKSIGATNNILVDATEDPASYSNEGLAPYAAIVFLNPAGEILSPAQTAAFDAFMAKGKGFVGIHNAAALGLETPRLAKWTAYWELIGTQYAQEGTADGFDVVNLTHPATVGFPTRWALRTETYAFAPALSSDYQVLVQTKPASPISWSRTLGERRAFYTAIGAYASDFRDPTYRRHIEGAILWAIGARAAGAPVVPPKVATDAGQSMQDAPRGGSGGVTGAPDARSGGDAREPGAAGGTAGSRNPVGGTGGGLAGTAGVAGAGAMAGKGGTGGMPAPGKVDGDSSGCALAGPSRKTAQPSALLAWIVGACALSRVRARRRKR